MIGGGAIPSASPRATKVGGSAKARSERPVYKVRRADGLGRSEPPNRAVSWEPIAATIRAPAELPRPEVRDLDAVQVGHREVGVPADAQLGQMDEGGGAAVLVHRIPPLPGHGQERTPLLRTRLPGLVPGATA